MSHVAELSIRRSDSTRRAYQRATLRPLSIGLALLLAGFLLHLWGMDRQEAEATHQSLRQSTEKSMKLAVSRDADKLAALLKLVVRDAAWQQAFSQRDRARLLAEVDPVFRQLRAQHRVTHFYFMTPQREMFLRVHDPQRFGDIIERQSAREAARLGQVASGLEVGSFGLFTLRVVAPWRDAGNKLLGYVELGMEIDQTLVELQQMVGHNFVILVDKRNLEKERWLDGMKSIGRTVDWDQFPNHVVIGRTAAVTNDALDLYRGEVLSESLASQTIKASHGNRSLAFDESPLLDLSGTALGRIVSIRDVSAAEIAQRYLILRVVVGLAVIWAVLMLLARRVINQVYDRLHSTERQREEFKHRARRDLMTGLFNHVSILHRLAKALERCKADGTPLAVLMFDLDHFKQINDTHGHPAGDDVLQRVARVMQHSVRPQDSVGRYGGEEFVIVLPAMDEDAALDVARRIRGEIEQLEITLGDLVLRITISGGLALAAGDDDTPESLVARADRAMYAAKNAGRNQVRQ